MRDKLFFVVQILFVFVIVLVLNFVYVLDNVIYPLNYKTEIINSCNLYNVEPSIVASIINAESNFKFDAISNKGAMGLMQILPQTAKFVCEMTGEQYSEDMLLNPEKNIKIGTYYIYYLSKKFENLPSLLCAYNAGEGKTIEWLNNKEYSSDKITLKSIPYKETQNYVQKVLKNYSVYKVKI